MKTIYCIGELLIDFVAEKQGNDLSKADVFTKKAGGAPANVACAISKLGGNSRFIGCVGRDPFGTFLLNILEENKVDISLAQRSKHFTTLAFVSLAEDGERDFVFSRGADKKLTYDSGVKNGFNGNMVHFGAATALLGGNLEDAYNRYFFDALTKESFISFDPNFRGDLWKGKEEIFVKKCRSFIEKSHLCKFSMEEVQLLSGEKDIEKACELMHDLGAQIITVTLGGEGTLVSTPNLKTTVPSIHVKPVDTTGAGDAFIGCLLYQISTLSKPVVILEDSDQLLDMIKKANVAGAVTTTNYGAIPSLPTLDEVENRLI
ncbi:carbohydrate kinase [Cytophaga sp. FL35]|uniref:carbohydrate kinase family protein n=1 Tax=Cytophaga sp. FL35 TaxID=1904456 RepID=UPI0016534C40|nr:carbohydrate kinase [Cytophaga sp. FL35]MBC6997786.1 carbohydrate kinase [Cytophaga sp. FL35]